MGAATDHLGLERYHIFDCWHWARNPATGNSVLVVPCDRGYFLFLDAPRPHGTTITVDIHTARLNSMMVAIERYGIESVPPERLLLRIAQEHLLEYLSGIPISQFLRKP